MMELEAFACLVEPQILEAFAYLVVVEPQTLQKGKFEFKKLETHVRLRFR